MSKVLNYLGIARKSGGLETGEDNSSAAVKAGKAKALIVASDTSEGARRRAEGYVFETQCVLLEIPFTKLEIAEITGKTGCSMAAVTDLGLAAAIAKALQDEFGEGYADAAESLKAAQRRVQERKAKKPERSRKMGNRRKSV